MTSTTHTPEKLDIGRVITQLFQVLGRNIVTFLLLAVILAGLPRAALGFLQLEAFGTVGGNIQADQMFSGQGVLMLCLGLLAGVFALVLQGAVIHGTVVYLNGRRPSLTACLATGLRYFFPLFVIGLIYGLAIAFGLVLLIVPGIMVAVAWCAAVPSEVAEGTGIFGAFSRSADLTRGSRWRIFVLFIVYAVIAMAIQSAILALTVGPMVAAAAAGAVDASAMTVQALIIQPVIGVLTSVIGAVGGAVLYVELRRTKEGVGVDTLADVFA